MRLIDADELTEAVWRERLDTRERIADLVARQPTVKGVTAMTNRDKLYRLCTYDLLLKINNGLMSFLDGSNDYLGLCVIDALTGDNTLTKYCESANDDCDKCILEWLDKECDADTKNY